MLAAALNGVSEPLPAVSALDEEDFVPHLA